MFSNDRLLGQILLLSLLGACLWVLAPFMTALFWAAVLAFASWPVMQMLTRALKGNASLAAGLLTGGWVVIVAGPLVWLGFNIADYIRAGTALIQNIRVTGLPSAPDWLVEVPMLGDRLLELWQAADEQGSALFLTAKPYMGQMGNWLLARSASIGAGILELALSLVLVFFFYRDGPRLALFVKNSIRRLIKDRADYYLDLVAGTVRRVVNGVIGTAVAQAIVALFGFLVAGVPGALLLAALTFMLSLIPMGPPLVWAPAVAWLFWQQDYGMAIFLLVWGFLVISSVDNFLKPYLISRGGNLPLVVVLMGVFGGLFAFGFMGLFLGPTLLAVAYSLVSDWIASNQPKVEQPNVDQP
ncbi:AI-2E family transporter [Pseudomonas sp. C27(2019)]|uniref:AI-2E family transporter n=1 Tax=Pseudomonas sp. C27(2019) TaxID=2604941 RepID=UPI0012448813|nr:AI-2E family transporter [Pseudomonas sp. C27(2019)]QEY59013.1 AI-2E family transporter [Pseudomonas sp. C27(2019)]